MPSDSLSILDIQEGLIECLAAREEAATPEEVSAADAAISAYLEAEVAKVDGIARAVRQWQAIAAADKAEASRLRERSAALEARVARLKEFVRFAMEKSGRRRIEGKLSTIRLQGAGGKQAVDVQGWDKEHERWIEDPDLLPDELCGFKAHISYLCWKFIKDLCADAPQVISVMDSMERVPRLSAIADALQQPCSDCYQYDDGKCETCGGSGKAGVPGARLRPRGEVVIIA